MKSPSNAIVRRRQPFGRSPVPVGALGADPGNIAPVLRKRVKLKKGREGEAGEAVVGEAGGGGGRGTRGGRMGRRGGTR